MPPQIMTVPATADSSRSSRPAGAPGPRLRPRPRLDLVGLGFELAGLGQYLGVEGSGLEQLGVGPVGHDLVLVQQHHPVGQGDGGQPVGDDQRGAALHLDPQSGMDPLLHLDVDGAGGVVEHHDRAD